MPLPSDETTPPVTKTNFVLMRRSRPASEAVCAAAPIRPVSLHGLQPTQSHPTSPPPTSTSAILRVAEDGTVERADAA